MVRGPLSLLVPACLMFAGCANTPSAPLHFTQTGGELKQQVWPSPPEPPRYRYVGQLTGEDNFKAQTKPSGMRRFFHWLVGIDNSDHSRNVLQRPQCGATDAYGRIYVTDASRQAVFVFDTPNRELHVWEWAQKGQRFLDPVGIAVGNHGEVWVADAELQQIFKLDRNGQPLGSFGAKNLRRPTGLARDSQTGWIYVADTRAQDIKVFDANGKLLKQWGHAGEGPGRFNAPAHLAYADGHLYVSDTYNARIQVFDRDGAYINSFGQRGLYLGNLDRPKGVAVDSQGHVYVVESYYDHLLVFDRAGHFLLPIGGTGVEPGQFYLPAGIWVDNQDQVYVADMFNGRIEVFKFLGGRQ